jgi:hypothetical protein
MHAYTSRSHLKRPPFALQDDMTYSMHIQRCMRTHTKMRGYTFGSHSKRPPFALQDDMTYSMRIQRCMRTHTKMHAYTFRSHFKRLPLLSEMTHSITHSCTYTNTHVCRNHSRTLPSPSRLARSQVWSTPTAACTSSSAQHKINRQLDKHAPQNISFKKKYKLMKEWAI